APDRHVARPGALSERLRLGPLFGFPLRKPTSLLSYHRGRGGIERGQQFRSPRLDAARPARDNVVSRPAALLVGVDRALRRVRHRGNFACGTASRARLAPRALGALARPGSEPRRHPLRLHDLWLDRRPLWTEEGAARLGPSL